MQGSSRTEPCDRAVRTTISDVARSVRMPPPPPCALPPMRRPAAPPSTRSPRSAALLVPTSDKDGRNTSDAMRIPQSILCIRGRAVKAADSKSAGVPPRRFESCRMRRRFLFAFAAFPGKAVYSFLHSSLFVLLLLLCCPRAAGALRLDRVRVSGFLHELSTFCPNNTQRA